MQAATVLIIEDDPDIQQLVASTIERRGFQADFANDGEIGLRKALENCYQLIVLDLGLPKLDGFEVCRRLRAKQVEVPLIILTSQGDEIDKVLGLQLGADDYITKPFSVREFLARVDAVLRRSMPESGKESVDVPEREQIVIGHLEIDLSRREVKFKGSAVLLTPLEFDLLLYLAESPGVVRTRDQLIEDVLGYTSGSYDNLVTTHMSRLRTKIEGDVENARYILTVRGVGYRLVGLDELE